MSVIAVQPAKAVSQSKIVIAAIIGNLLEFFDFTVYSFFALMIAKLFFPATTRLSPRCSRYPHLQSALSRGRWAASCLATTRTNEAGVPR
ncbi:MAG: transporter [Caballeronia mineralivorans]|jgi:hypothetical protein|nr:transporter [Caballeronia mineralivorans]MEA3103830.1 transporter, family, proline/betaine transporter [Caballeronia mineralivorans]